jgi:hypothetical protein
MTAYNATVKFCTSCQTWHNGDNLTCDACREKAHLKRERMQADPVRRAAHNKYQVDRYHADRKTCVRCHGPNESERWRTCDHCRYQRKQAYEPHLSPPHAGICAYCHQPGEFIGAQKYHKECAGPAERARWVRNKQRQAAQLHAAKTRRCAGCHEMKSLDEFASLSNGRHANYCDICCEAGLAPRAHCQPLGIAPGDITAAWAVFDVEYDEVVILDR